MVSGKVGSSPQPPRAAQELQSSDSIQRQEKNDPTAAQSPPQDPARSTLNETERRSRAQESTFQGHLRRMEVERATPGPGQHIDSSNLERINDPSGPGSNVATLQRGIDTAHSLLDRATEGTIGGLGARNPGRETQQAGQLIDGAVRNIGNSGDYQALPAESRQRLWESILLTGNNRAGQRLLHQLGPDVQSGIQDMRSAQEALGRRFPEMTRIVQEDAHQVAHGGITNGIQSAQRTLFDTGLLTQFSRDLHVGSSWNDQVREARQTMSGVVDSMINRGPDSYFRLPQQQREQVWQNILMTQDTATGRRLMGFLGERAVGDFDAATRAISQQARGFPQEVLDAQAESIRNTGRNATAVEIERQAAISGDPRPQQPSQESMERYIRLTSSAYTRAQLAATTDEARRPLLHAFMSFMGSFPTEPSSTAIARAQAESMLQQHSPALEGPLFALSFAQNLGDASQTYDRFATPAGRMRYALEQAALQEAGGNPGRQQQIMAELRQTGSQLNGGLAWLQRHQDHPANRPAGVYQAP